MYSECMAIVERLVNGKPVYDSTWFAMIMFQYGAVFRFLELSRELFETLPVKRIMSLSHLCLAAMSADALALSSFSQTKRALIDELYGDLRLNGLSMLKAAFHRLQEEASSASKLVPM